jgi:hypothetical protein
MGDQRTDREGGRRERRFIIWRNCLVGWMVSPKKDRLDFSGQWQSAGYSESLEFLEALKQAVAAGRGVEVRCDGFFTGLAYAHPETGDGEIKITLSRSRSDKP